MGQGVGEGATRAPRPLPTSSASLYTRRGTKRRRSTASAGAGSASVPLLSSVIELLALADSDAPTTRYVDTVLTAARILGGRDGAAIHEVFSTLLAHRDRDLDGTHLYARLLGDGEVGALVSTCLGADPFTGMDVSAAALTSLLHAELADVLRVCHGITVFDRAITGRLTAVIVSAVSFELPGPAPTGHATRRDNDQDIFKLRALWFVLACALDAVAQLPYRPAYLLHLITIVITNAFNGAGAGADSLTDTVAVVDVDVDVGTGTVSTRDMCKLLILLRHAPRLAVIMTVRTSLRTVQAYADVFYRVLTELPHPARVLMAHPHPGVVNVAASEPAPKGVEPSCVQRRYLLRPTPSRRARSSGSE